VEGEAVLMAIVDKLVIQVDTKLATDLLRNLSIGVAAGLDALPRITSVDGTQWVAGADVDALAEKLRKV
jgi:hypothetical protein